MNPELEVRPRIAAVALLIAGLLVLAGATTNPALADDRDGRPETVFRFDKSGPYEVAPVLAAVARQLGQPLVIDPQLAGAKVEVAAPGDYTLDALRTLLDARDVRLVWVRGAKGDLTLRAVHQRNLPHVLDTPPRLLAPGEALPALDEMVEVHVRIEHGNGNDIFAAVRGLMSRDPDRLGNILYIRGAERLVFVDLASKVRSYVETVKRLDVPPTTYRIVLEIWSGPRAVLSDLAGASAREVRETLRELGDEKDRGVALIGESVKDVASGVTSWERTALVEGDGGRVRRVRTNLSLSVDGPSIVLGMRGGSSIAARGTEPSPGDNDSLAWSLDGNLAAAHGTERLFLDLSPDEAGPSLAVIARVVELGREKD